MKIDVHLLDNVTGERRIYAEDYEYERDDSLIRYQYGDGNYSCDCNRYLFFWRAIGIDPHRQETGVEEPGCFDERYIVEKIVERGTDRIIYFDAPADKVERGTRSLPQVVS